MACISVDVCSISIVIDPLETIVSIMYSYGSNMLKQCVILVQVRFAIRKSGLDIYYNKLCIHVVSQIAERHKM